MGDRQPSLDRSHLNALAPHWRAWPQVCSRLSPTDKEELSSMLTGSDDEVRREIYRNGRTTHRNNGIQMEISNLIIWCKACDTCNRQGTLANMQRNKIQRLFTIRFLALTWTCKMGAPKVHSSILWSSDWKLEE